MTPGSRYSLRWALPHRLEAVVVSADEHTVVADCNHRCDPECHLMRDYGAALVLSGRRSFLRREFEAQFQEMADALALPPAR